MSDLTLLHITDCHLSPKGSVDDIDLKLKARGVAQPLRAEILKSTLESVRDSLLSSNTILDAVVFSGDGTYRGDKDGQKILRRTLLDILKPVGITAKKIVVTPGNHDIVAGTKEGSRARYELFGDAWIKGKPAVVPFLDGVHKPNSLALEDHVLRDPNNRWAIFPINSSNWCQINIGKNDNEDVARVKKFISKHNNSKAAAEAFASLCRYDVARVSKKQLQALKLLVEQTGDVKVRIAVLHHHLLPINSREEFKPFADITNLGQLRQVLRELEFHIVIHGHKHAKAAYYDYVSPEADISGRPHRILTLSGGTFGNDAAAPEVAMQIVRIDEALHAPGCTITPVGIATPGRHAAKLKAECYPLWENDPQELGPSFITGTSIDEVYHRVSQTISHSPGRPVVCTVDLTDDIVNPYPTNYPYGDDRKHEWFKDTVKWWQLPASRIEERIPYIHGSRLRRYGGSYNQIDRVVELLRKEGATSKAVALVIDPARDFGKGTAFASFCFVQFCLRDGKFIDCIGYYRAQEFTWWWPVNVAELRYLQKEVADQLNLKCGKITTITPYPRVSENVRVPTKVAVPLIDQWIDNHPQRIAQMALALSGKNQNGSASEGMKHWNRCLTDLEQGIQDFHEDGVPVSIEGLALLKDWLEAACASKKIVGHIQRLHDANDAHRNNEDLKVFNRWRRLVQPILTELREMTKTAPAKRDR